MSELPSKAEVVIVGGGVMGASTAYHLARAGVRDVLLLERDDLLGQGATGRCAGGVRYQFATEVNIRLSLASLPMIEQFEEETGVDPQYRQCGYLFALSTDADVETFRRNVQLQHALGIETEWLDGEEVRRRLPEMLLDDALAGTYFYKDGLADPNSIVQGYAARARDLGVKILTGTPVESLETEGSRVRGVRTASGPILCGHVVNAAGPWAPLLAETAGVRLPITPIRRQMVTTTALPELRHDFPFVVDFAKSLYFHREGDGILTGMSNPGQAPGFDQTVDSDWEIRAMGAAAERMPMLERAGRLAGWAGLYETTPDAHPIFGRSGLDGLWIVGGFSGHGFMHGPIAGQLMAEFLTRGRAETVDVSTLDLERFSEGRLIREYNVI